MFRKKEKLTIFDPEIQKTIEVLRGGDPIDIRVVNVSPNMLEIRINSGQAGIVVKQPYQSLERRTRAAIKELTDEYWDKRAMAETVKKVCETDWNDRKNVYKPSDW